MQAATGRAVRFGFLGAGGIAAKALAPAVHAADGAVLQAAAARDPARAAALGPAGRAYGDYRALLDDPEVDVVYISLSNEAHRPWTLAALAAGKHVLCEKPLGLDAGEVSAMVAAASASERLLVEAFWYRWHPRTRRLEELVAEGALGPVVEVEADFSYDGDPTGEGYRLDPARGGGALYDVGCYAVSAAHLVLGPSMTVVDVAQTRGPTGVDLETVARLRVDEGVEAGARATVRCGIAVPDRQVLRAVGQGATVEFADGEAFGNWHAPSSLRIRTPDGGVRLEEFAPVDAYRLMVTAVAARVRGEDAFLVGLDHSRQVATTMDAVVRAAAGAGTADPGREAAP